MPDGEPLLDLRGVTRDYRGLRPLRVQQLQLHAGESIALLGFDLAMAEVLVSLLTAAQLPDTGEILIFGQPTSGITNTEEWVRTLDRFGLVTDRAVLVEQFTGEQNLAMPLTLDITEPSPELRARVRRLGEEVGLTAADLASPTAALSAPAKLRLRLARALALDPQVLIAEHPNAIIPRDEAPAFAADFARVVQQRRLGALVLTADQTFAGAISDRVLTLQPATGELKSMSGWRRWFS